MNLFHRPPKIGVLKLTRVVNFDKCKEEHCIVTSFQYGGHPMRVVAFCPFHAKCMILDWKDTSARLTNRLWGTFPALFQATILFGTIGFLVYELLVYYHLLK